MNANMSLTAIQYGVGPIGRHIVEEASKKGINFIGAIDIDPTKVGTDLRDIAKINQSSPIEITDDAESALSNQPDIVFHSTSSYLEHSEPQLRQAMEYGADVISTTEQLSYPWNSNADIAQRLDAVAKENNATCIGSGINPGFVMDSLPVFLSTPMQSVDNIEIKRVQDASERRKPLQEKIGAGLTAKQFEKEVSGGGGHVGSSESVSMLAAALGWDVSRISESIEPILSEETIQTDHLSVSPGEVSGIKQTAEAIHEGSTVISLDLQMSVSVQQSKDEIHFHGQPDLSVEIHSGYPGDTATASIIANLVPTVHQSPPGLKTMTEIPLPSFQYTY